MDGVVKAKSVAFAKRIVRLYKYLCEEKKEYLLSKQVLRSGTSIGANVTEAAHGISKKDFTAKMYIAFKECAETIYWLELLRSGGYISEREHKSLLNDCEELRRILSAITKTSQNPQLLTPHSSLLTTNEGEMKDAMDTLVRLSRDKINRQAYQRRLDELNSYNRVLQQIADKDATIANKDATIAEDKAIIADKDATIADKDATIADKDATIAEDKAIIADKDKIIAELMARLDSKNP
jgi:four helix bundle protein